MTEAIDPAVYSEDYFEDGPHSGISNYERYRWLPERSIGEARQYQALCALRNGARVLDYGCAKGFLVRAFREIGFAAYGCDVSEYAITCADPVVRDRLFLLSQERAVCSVGSNFDLAVASHVLEHQPQEEVAASIRRLRGAAARVAVSVPVGNHGSFWNEKHNYDLTHVTIKPPGWWLQQFQAAGARVTSVSVIRWHMGRPDVISIVSDGDRGEPVTQQLKNSCGAAEGITSRSSKPPHNSGLTATRSRVSDCCD